MKIMKLTADIISLIGAIAMHVGDSEINVFHVTEYHSLLVYNKENNEIECPVHDKLIADCAELAEFMKNNPV